jgi:hypothetical protein
MCRTSSAWRSRRATCDGRRQSKVCEEGLQALHALSASSLGLQPIDIEEAFRHSVPEVPAAWVCSASTLGSPSWSARRAFRRCVPGVPADWGCSTSTMGLARWSARKAVRHGVP